MALPMKTIFTTLLVLFTTLGFTKSSPAQVNGNAFPAAAKTAKTVAIINDTHVDAVGEGAADALRAWGRYRVIDDPDTADITLRFDKSKDHSGQDSQKPDPTSGQTNYSYSMSFSTSIHMKVYLKDADSPFYTTRTDDSKKKAGMSCVSDFRSALQAAQGR
jgi:hypothetical protein